MIFLILIKGGELFLPSLGNQAVFTEPSSELKVAILTLLEILNNLLYFAHPVRALSPLYLIKVSPLNA